MDGWTPEQITGLVTAVVALVTAIAGVVAAWKSHAKTNALAAEVHNHNHDGGASDAPV